MGNMGAGGITVKDLKEEQVDSGGRIKDSFSPGVTNLSAGGPNGIRSQNSGDIWLDPGNGSADSESHPWPPIGMVQ